MAGSVNKVILLGHLGDDVKIHYFDEGNCIARFPIATNESYTNKQSGEKVVTTEWHNIVVRNKLAEICEKYLKKGDRIYCEGRIKTRQWQDDSGAKRYTTEIHTIDLTFLNNKDSDNSNSATPNLGNENIQSPKKLSKEDVATNKPEDDLPF